MENRQLMNGAKPAGYFLCERREMLRFIPRDAGVVLDVGCGAGVFGAAVKDVFGCEVWGIEIDREMAISAKAKLDEVITGDLLEILPNMPDGKFDCIVFNDVLEHLVDPSAVLLMVKSKLTSKGVITCSIPNVRYFYVLRDLIVNKQWSYEDAGVLDRTHLRFFTKKTIIKLFSELDYEILQLEGIHKIKAWKVTLLNILFWGSFDDTRYQQFACVVKPK